MSRRKSYRHIVAAVHETLWAILPSKLDVIMELIDLRAAGEEFSGTEIAARIGDIEPPPLSVQPAQSQISVLNLFGTIFHRADNFTAFSGGTSAQRFGQAFDAAIADESVQSILINVDSPGGTVPGIQELGDKIFEARGTKPITSLINPMAASAAYWVAAQADEVIAIPSATSIGSIGVLKMHTDRSQANEQDGIKRTFIASVPHKAAFNPDNPLTESDLAHANEQVAQIHQTFVAAVARGRGLSVEAVANDFGQGRTFLASEALARGMIDRIATLDAVLAELGAETPAPSATTTNNRHRPAFASQTPHPDSDPRFQSIADLLG